MSNGPATKTAIPLGPVRVVARRVKAPLFEIQPTGPPRPRLPMGFQWLEFDKCFTRPGPQGLRAPYTGDLKSPGEIYRGPRGNLYLAFVYRDAILATTEYGEGMGDLDGLLRPLYDLGIREALAEIADFGKIRRRPASDLLTLLGYSGNPSDSGNPDGTPKEPVAPVVVPPDPVEIGLQQYVGYTALMLSRCFPDFRFKYAKQITVPAQAYAWAVEFPNDRELVRELACSETRYRESWENRWNASPDDDDDDDPGEHTVGTLVFDLYKAGMISAKDAYDRFGITMPPDDKDGGDT